MAAKKTEKDTPYEFSVPSHGQSQVGGGPAAAVEPMKGKGFTTEVVSGKGKPHEIVVKYEE